MRNKNFCLIVNPAAGNGQSLRALPTVENALKHLSVSYRVVIPNTIMETQIAAQTAIQQDEIIAVLSGDGTIKDIANILYQHQGILALIPGGRGNDLARSLNIPTDLKAACETILHGNEIKIDMACVNQTPFVGICSLGFDSIAITFANRAKFIPGSAVYLYGGLRALLTWQSINFLVEVDGKKFEHFGYTVAVANSAYYGGGMCLAPSASLHDGLLDVVLIGDISKWRFLRNLPKVYKGTHVNEPGFTILRGKNIQITSHPKFTIFADGDAIGASPAHFKIIPNALSVIVP